MSWKVTINVPTKVGEPITATVDFDKGWIWDGNVVKDAGEHIYLVFFEPDAASRGGSELVDLGCVLYSSGNPHDLWAWALTVDTAKTPTKKDLRALDRKSVKNGHA